MSRAPSLGESPCHSRHCVFLDRAQESARLLRRIEHLRGDLGLRVGEQDSAENPKEIRPLHAELVLRQVPGKSPERRRHAQRLDVALAPGAFENPARRKVVGVTCPPGRLCPPSPLGLALRPRASALAIAHPRIATKPSPTDRTGPSPPRAHRPSFGARALPCHARVVSIPIFVARAGECGPPVAAAVVVVVAPAACARRRHRAALTLSLSPPSSRAARSPPSVRPLPSRMDRFCRSHPGHFSRVLKLPP